MAKRHGPSAPAACAPSDHRREVLSEQLQTALNRRVIIEQAKGVLSQHLGVPMDTAFDQLRRYARGNNLRLAEVARGLVAGELNLDVVSPANSPTDSDTST